MLLKIRPVGTLGCVVYIGKKICEVCMHVRNMAVFCKLRILNIFNILAVISGESRISRRGGMNPLRGVWTPNVGTFWQKCMQKQKN